MNRHALMALSIVVSFVIHGAIVAIAPRVPVLRPNRVPEDLLQSVRVKVVEDTAPALQPRNETASDLATRPSTVTDMLDQNPEDLEPEEALLNQLADIPDMEMRAALEDLAREHDLRKDDTLLAKMDQKIIEISQKAAREDIQVPRRIVRPSPNRFLAPGEYPLLRNTSAQEIEGALSFGPLPKASAIGSSPISDRPDALPPKEEDIMEPVAPEKSEDKLRVPDQIARNDRIAKLKNERKFEFIDEMIDIQLDTYVPPDEPNGYFRLSILPKKGEDIEVLPKDVTFVIDASSSISQRKLDSMTEGVAEIVDKLRPEDRFNVVVFRDRPEMLSPDLAPAAPDQKAAAKAMLARQESHGKTDIYEALRPVVLNAPRDGLPGIVLVMTDGRPNTGVRNAREIINGLTDENELRNSIYAYGSGNTVKRYMLDLLALRNKGDSHVTPSTDDITSELPGFFSHISDPILVDLNADYGRIDEDAVFPKRVPDFYKGQAVTVYGRFDPKKDEVFAMRLTGRASELKKEVIFTADLSKADTGDKSIAQAWAKKKIYHLIGEMSRLGDAPELRQEIEGLSRQYDVGTAYDD
jgi:von Willebrand factor type A domain